MGGIRDLVVGHLPGGLREVAVEGILQHFLAFDGDALGNAAQIVTAVD